MSQQWPRARRTAVRFVLRHRRTLVLGLVAIALVNLVSPMLGGRTRPVVVAVRPIAAGALITGADVKSSAWPAKVGAAGWPVRPDQVIGRRAAGQVAAGDPITGTTLLARTDAAIGADRVLAPVRVADSATLALLSPGDTIDVIAAWPATATAGANATTIAARVRVVSVPSAPKTTGYQSEGGLVVIAVPPATAVRIAAAAVTARISVTLQPR